jgi:hypothetical protein
MQHSPTIRHEQSFPVTVYVSILSSRREVTDNQTSILFNCASVLQ